MILIYQPVFESILVPNAIIYISTQYIYLIYNVKRIKAITVCSGQKVYLFHQRLVNGNFLSY